jgi:polyisoprenoid-binding protein YceI
MTRIARLAVAPLAAAGLALAAVPAAAEPYEIDPAHTHILFVVSHLGFSNTHGEFLEFDGEFDLDPDAPENSSISMTIDAASLDTAHDERDAHLRNADFFNVEEFPEITFETTGVEVTGEDTAQLTGDLTMLGVTRPVTLDVVLNAMGDHPFQDKTVAGFTATGTVDRTEFGMTYGAPAVGEQVEITIEMEASPAG